MPQAVYCQVGSSSMTMGLPLRELCMAMGSDPGAATGMMEVTCTKPFEELAVEFDTGETVMTRAVAKDCITFMDNMMEVICAW